MHGNDMLPEDEMEVPRLQQLFKSAFLKTEIDDDGDLMVHSEAGLRVFISIDAPKKMLKFTAVHRIKEEATEIEKHALANTLNDEVVLARFSVPRDDILLADYFLLYEEGISTYQIVNALRWFSRVVIAAIVEYDKENLVE